MKYIMLIPDGAADYPIEALNGRTPLQAAKTQMLDYLAKEGRVGVVKTIPDGMYPGSDVANLALLGYDPNIYYPGRASFEAISMGIPLREGRAIFRCNLVTVNSNIMVDYSAGHIESEDAKLLVDFLNSKVERWGARIYPGVSYRHILTIDGNFKSLHCTPPHDIMQREIEPYLPRGDGESVLREMMKESRRWLSSHELNKKRREEGKAEANMIWLWGKGEKPSLPPFERRFSLKGAVISAVDLLKGIALSLGMEVVNVPGATGYYDTNYKGKAEYAIQALERVDFVLIHVEAPDEAGHSGDLTQKILAIENFDNLVVKTILDRMKGKEYRVLVAPDHPTPLSVRTHTSESTPFLLYGAKVEKDAAERFDEFEAERSSFKVERGYELIDYFIER